MAVSLPLHHYISFSPFSSCSFVFSIVEHLFLSLAPPVHQFPLSLVQISFSVYRLFCSGSSGRVTAQPNSAKHLPRFHLSYSILARFRCFVRHFDVSFYLFIFPGLFWIIFFFSLNHYLFLFYPVHDIPMNFHCILSRLVVSELVSVSPKRRRLCFRNDAGTVVVLDETLGALWSSLSPPG